MQCLIFFQNHAMRNVCPSSVLYKDQLFFHNSIKFLLSNHFGLHSNCFKWKTTNVGDLGFTYLIICPKFRELTVAPCFAVFLLVQEVKPLLSMSSGEVGHLMS